MNKGFSIGGDSTFVKNLVKKGRTKIASDESELKKMYGMDLEMKGSKPSLNKQSFCKHCGSKIKESVKEN